MDKSVFHPIGPVGSILIGLGLCLSDLAGLRPGGVSLGWIGLAFLMGGIIMLATRMMNSKKNDIPK